jgi:hypothetical protein
MRARREQTSVKTFRPPRRAGAVAVLALLLGGAGSASAAGGSPQLALVQVTPYPSSAAVVTLELVGNFNYEDTVQLPLPLDVIVAQGDRITRFDLAGHAFTSVGGAGEQPDSGPGVIAVKQHAILLVLPSGFGAGATTVQLVAHYQGETFASNTLGFTL